VLCHMFIFAPPMTKIAGTERLESTLQRIDPQPPVFDTHVFPLVFKEDLPWSYLNDRIIKQTASLSCILALTGVFIQWQHQYRILATFFVPHRR
jgi:hypothetical protein